MTRAMPGALTTAVVVEFGMACVRFPVQLQQQLSKLFIIIAIMVKMVIIYRFLVPHNVHLQGSCNKTL
jgi:hypothetical protein